jgi:preprotein translocase subunit SecB
MEKTKRSYFQFKGYLIRKSFIEVKEGEMHEDFNLSFHPKGIIDKKNFLFRLELGVIIKDKNSVVNVEIEICADFSFGKDIEENMLNNYFYINAPALIFPYIRAYISTITTLSGINSIILPTLNMENLGKELKNNTIEL